MKTPQEYLEIARITLERDGTAALLQKIARKLYHTARRYLPRRWASPLPRPRPLALPTAVQPLVSFLIYTRNNATHTHNCLLAIARTVGDRVPYEVILVDDASTDDLPRFLRQVTGASIFKQETPQGAIAALNYAAQQARGEWLVLLDRDCQLTAGWLEAVLGVFQPEASSNPPADHLGIVGTKVTYDNGRLRWAGGIVWQDGTLSPYGEGDHPDEPEYNYRRPVDFAPLPGCIVRAQVWQELGGLHAAYTSPVYGAADLGMAARQAGWGVLYQPHADLICRQSDLTPLGSQWHPETGDLAKDRAEFGRRWAEALPHHCRLDDSASGDRAPRRLLPSPTALVIDTLVPTYDRDSGSLRLFQILQLLQQHGYHIIFLPEHGHDQRPYTTTLEAMGIEVLYLTHARPDPLLRLSRRLDLIDIAWVCRPELCAKYFPVLQQRPSIRLIYDTIDLHFLRLQRQWELEGKPPDRARAWEEMRAMELAASQIADTTLVVTEVEKAILTDLGAARVEVVPNIHRPYTGARPGWGDRAGLLFIGGYYHLPNVDAVQWLCREIMPLVWAQQPDLHVTLLGSNPSPAVKALASDRVAVPGYIPDVEPYFLSHRLFVAPLRYGAGMKGKIGHSLSYGLPTITTSIGAEGMNLRHGEHALIADEAAALAQCILTLYDDELLWEKLSAGAIAAMQPYLPDRVGERIARLLAALTRQSEGKSGGSEEAGGC